jgi:hypothetical protein
MVKKLSGDYCVFIGPNSFVSKVIFNPRRKNLSGEIENLQPTACKYVIRKHHESFIPPHLKRSKSMSQEETGEWKDEVCS